MSESEIKKVFDEASSEFNEHFNANKVKLEEIEGKMSELSKKIISNINSKCRYIINWVNQNAKLDGKGALRFNNVSDEEGKAKLEDMKNCISSNEHGIRQYFANNESQLNSINENLQLDIEKCGNVSSSEKELKKCFVGVLETRLEEYKRYTSDVENKINQLNKLI
jgi:Skp family chaperone for outer membrane proteins